MYKNFLTIIFSLFIFLSFSNNLFAQKTLNDRQLQIIPDENIETTTYNNRRVEVVTGKPVALYNLSYQVRPDQPEAMAMQFLVENSNLLKINPSDIVFRDVVETPAAYHVHFDQYIDGYPVYNSDINVTISKQNKVVFVMNGYKLPYGAKEQIKLSSLNISRENAFQTAKNYLGVNTELAFDKVEPIVYYNKGSFRLAQKVNIVPSEQVMGDWEILVDASTGEVFRVEDKSCYHGEGNQSRGVNGSGWVFDPDPITHARTTYGTTGFVDNNDQDSDSLTAHLETRDLIDITFNGTNYSLVSPWAQIVDFESPFTGLHTSTNSNFYYTRSDDNFEAVNVFFHIDQSMKYINQTLGINLMPYQYAGGVKFDPHGFNGDDNSHYLTSIGAVSFGDGGVDDAEDLSVIIHELGHGIHDWVTSGGLSQVNGLSEGCGDYWAVSYIRSTGYWNTSDPAYNWVFIWDGHNPFWPGRITNYTAHYPEGLVGQVHTDGQMWASSLMAIYDLIGKEPTDRNFLEGLAMTNGSSNQQDAAYAFMQSDQLNYSGSHIPDIATVFIARGYITSPVTVDFTTDVTSGNAPLTVQFTDISVSTIGPITSWEWDFNNDGNIDATSQNPSWIYQDIGIYSIKLTVSDGTNSNSITKTDLINVTDPNQVTDTIFSDKFENGLGAWTISNDGGSTSCVWQIRSAPFPNTYTLPATSSGGIMTADVDECGNGSTLLSSAIINQTLDCSNYDIVTIEFDNDFRILDAQDEAHVEVSTDGGSSWIGVWEIIGVSVRNTHELINISSLAAGNSNVKIRLRSVQPGWDWWWVLDNIIVYGTYVVPVELTSFTASVSENQVNLNWETATELNNSGFEVQRKINNNNFEMISFISGFGTSTEKHSYKFTDELKDEGTISYRLKQIDFNGDFSYSNIIEVDFNLPKEFSLNQNYPNPFNPSTRISYSLAVDSKVTLSIYNLLGEQIALLVNEVQPAGRYDLNFKAGNLTSGTYFYRIEAAGKDGKSFTSTKKMIYIK